MAAALGALGALLQAVVVLGILAFGARFVLRTQRGLVGQAWVLLIVAMLAYGVIASAFGGHQ